MDATKRKITGLLAAILLASGIALAADAIEVEDAWAPPASAGGPAAAYVTLANRGGERDRLLRAETPIARRVDLHTHRIEGDIARMRRLDSLDIPPGERVVFAPGGLHLMLSELSRPLAAGETFPLTLVFERAGTVEAAVRVGSGAGKGAPTPKPMPGGEATPHRGM